MRNILIVGIPRSGTTNLLKSLSLFYKYKAVFEPTYEELKEMDIDKKVVKVIAGPWFPNKLLIEQSKRFDGVVIISRKDLRSSAESLYVMRTYNDRIVNRQWSNEFIPENIKEYDEQVLSDKMLHEFARTLSIDVNYYEDVYSKKKLNDGKFGLHPEPLHDRNKLRRIRNQKTFI